jgi:hypothetical protein
VKPWRNLSKPELVTIVAPDGTERCKVQAFFAGNIFIVEDMNADMQPGDELRRRLPNGRDDVYRIDDPALFDTGRLVAHYQVKVSRKGIFAPDTGGYYVNVSGPNSRVNIASTDNSTNVVNSGDVFGDMRQAIEAGVSNEARRVEIIAAIDAAEEAKGTSGFLAAYQKVVSVAADHLGLLLPFLPAFTSLLG